MKLITKSIKCINCGQEFDTPVQASRSVHKVRLDGMPDSKMGLIAIQECPYCHYAAFNMDRMMHSHEHVAKAFTSMGLVLDFPNKKIPFNPLDPYDVYERALICAERNIKSKLMIVTEYSYAMELNNDFERLKYYQRDLIGTTVFDENGQKVFDPLYSMFYIDVARRLGYMASAKCEMKWLYAHKGEFNKVIWAFYNFTKELIKNKDSNEYYFSDIEK